MWHVRYRDWKFDALIWVYSTSVRWKVLRCIEGVVVETAGEVQGKRGEDKSDGMGIAYSEVGIPESFMLTLSCL